MADRACRSFQPNIFNKNKCQNCYKLQEAHRTSQTSLDAKPKGATEGPSLPPSSVSMPTTYLKPTTSKTIVKSGLLSLMVHDSTKEPTKLHEKKWNRRWVILNSTGIVDIYVYDELHTCASEVHVRGFNLDDCTTMFTAEVDTGEPFSHGLTTPAATFYFKAENRLDMDNWIRVFKPFVQAASAYPFRRGTRNSVGSLEALEKSATSTTSLTRGHSFGKGSGIGRPSTPPRSSSSYVTRAKYSSSDAIDGLHTVESLKQQLEKLREENKLLRENPAITSKSREAIHILEQELKTKSNRLKELESEHSKCKDYQKAIIFQEQELQDSRFKIKELRQQLEEAEKKSKQHKGKLNIHAKELAEAKADLDEANSIISIHKANIESLKSELSTMKHEVLEKSGKVILADEEPESDRVFSFETNGDTEDKKGIESKLKFLVQKLKQNERELLIKTRELEKANESRSKVAKYTRSLLQELETKLSNNERKLAETEHQLNNSTIELEYENEQRIKLEKDNEKLTDELDKLKDIQRKARLSGDAIALIEETKKDKTSEFYELKAKLLDTEKKLQDTEKEISLKEKDFVNELEDLKSKLELSEALSEKRESKYKECKAELGKAREESSEMRRLSQTLETENEARVQQLLSAKDSQLQTANDKLSKLEKEVSLLNQKNEELETQLDSVDEKLCKSLEKQYYFSEEKETLLSDNKSLELRVKTLEDKISDLKLALNEAKANNSVIKAERLKINQLERSLEEKVKHMEELQEVLNDKEKIQSKLDQQRSEEADDAKQRIRDLEKELRDFEFAMNKKLKAKDSVIEGLKMDREKLEKECTLLEATKDETPLDGNRIQELEQQLSQYELFLTTAKDKITGYEQQIQDLNSKQKDSETQNRDLERKISSLESELEVYREKISTAEERLLDYEVEEKLLTAELQNKEQFTHEVQVSVSSVQELESDPNHDDKETPDYNALLEEKTTALISSESKVIELAEELDKRLKLEQEATEWIEGVEANLGKTEAQLVNARTTLLAKSQELEREKYNILDLVELSRKYIKELEVSLAAEKAKAEELDLALKDKDVPRGTSTPDPGRDTLDGIWSREESLREVSEKLVVCEQERDAYKVRVGELTKELEETKNQLNERLDSAEKAHQKDMKKLNEETLKVSGAAKSEGDELRLRLTSRVITLQSDISELKAAHQTGIEKLKARHKKELEKVRREAILETSMKQPINESAEDVNASVVEMENEMKKMMGRYEAQMEVLKQNHQREMERLKRSSDHGEGLKTEVTQLQAEMEGMSQKYMQEIEMLKNKHAEELEQLKTDMTVVMASMTTSCSPSKDHSENTQQLKERIKELETEMDEISQKYNEELKTERESQQKELDQIRDDMMTVIQAVKSQQYDLDPDTEQLQRTVHEQEEEIKRLRESTGDTSNIPPTNELTTEIEKLKEANRVLEEEKDEAEKSLKRQEAATMFGLRRTEEMSNKIYQMQKEMEDIDRKYMKEINMYKDAYEREKESKTSDCDDNEDLSSQNEELRLELEELRLKMEEEESFHENELQIYKEKLGQEKLLDIEHLVMKIKGLEDSIEEIKLEHQREIEELQESHSENVKNLTSEHNKALRNIKKETESSITRTKSSRLEEEHKEKVRTLEFKIEELESLLEVKKRRHKEEVRSLKERLDEEMQRRSEDVRNYEQRLRNCDASRRPSTASGPGASEYFRKQLAELRAENRNLKDELEILREQLTSLRSKSSSHTEKPARDIKRLQSESDIQVSQRKSSKETKEPLRKTSSDADAYNRTSRPSTSTTEKRNETTEKPASKQYTRQTSKNEAKSVAERVAMFQTPSKNGKKSTRIK